MLQSGMVIERQPFVSGQSDTVRSAKCCRICTTGLDRTIFEARMVYIEAKILGPGLLPTFDKVEY